MSSRLNTRQTLRGRTVQFKEDSKASIARPAAQRISNTQSPLVNVSWRLSDSKIYGTYCMSPQDGAFDFTAESEDTKVIQLTYSHQDAESSSTRGVQLHITVEKTVQYDNDEVSGPSPEALPTLESKYPGLNWISSTSAFIRPTPFIVFIIHIVRIYRTTGLGYYRLGLFIQRICLVLLCSNFNMSYCITKKGMLL
jgi:hypothetical protein